MNQILTTIAQQINSRELSFARFKLAFSEGKDEYIAVIKGLKRIQIKYDFAHDTYTITKQKFKRFFGNPIDLKEEILELVYFDQLQDIISEHFNFEYVMEGILNHEVRK